MNLKNYFGPSTLIAAAFIGPGTITTCTLAGTTANYELIWALLFSTFATLILQEMSARLGFVTQKGLGEALNQKFEKGFSKYVVFILVFTAIIIGNAAYEAGNLSGGILGLELLIGPSSFWPIVLGVISFSLLLYGGYKWIENILIGLVILMSISFLITSIMVKPDWLEVLSGFVPRIPEDGKLLLIMGLIGTTVVPYNLFLHASTISKKYKQEASIKDIRIENNISIILGGVISMLIIITAASVSKENLEIKNAFDLALQLEPSFGESARILMGIGLLAAGLSSALTAPIAAAYAAKGLFNLKSEKDFYFKLTWGAILTIGVLVSSLNLKPIFIIKTAQIANALLLPFIAGFLIYICNSKLILKNHTNGKLSNILGISVLAITVFLSLKSFGVILGYF